MHKSIGTIYECPSVRLGHRTLHRTLAVSARARCVFAAHVGVRAYVMPVPRGMRRALSNSRLQRLLQSRGATQSRSPFRQSHQSKEVASPWPLAARPSPREAASPHHPRARRQRAHPHPRSRRVRRSPPHRRARNQQRRRLSRQRRRLPRARPRRHPRQPDGRRRRRAGAALVLASRSRRSDVAR
jgi:hypothetical protein